MAADQVNYVGVNYRICGFAMDIIADLQGTDKLQVAVEAQGISGKNLFFDKYDMALSERGFTFGPPVTEPTPAPTGQGRLMVAQLAPDEFLFMGASAVADIRPAFGSGYTVAQYLRVEIGNYEDGVWKVSSVINGDISRGVSLPASGAMIKVKLIRY